jgi:anti-repressor protein
MKNEVMVKEVKFEGANLLATEKDGKVYVGVSAVCSGIGFSKSQKDNQVQKIKTDFVISKGCFKFQAGIFDRDNEALGLELDYLPLWLAKINITPSIIEENPKLAENLVIYQLKVKDVLAKAFIKNEFKAPTTLKEALMLALEQQEKIEQLELENKTKEVKLVEQAPKVEFADKLLKSKCDILISDFAKVMADENLAIGSKRLFTYLRDKKYIYNDRGSNKPYQIYVDKGYFKLKENLINSAFKDFVTYTTLISPSGQVWLYNKLKEEEQFKK